MGLIDPGMLPDGIALDSADWVNTGGAASKNAALADASDTTMIVDTVAAGAYAGGSGSGPAIRFTFAAPAAIPALAQVRYVRPRFRWSAVCTDTINWSSYPIRYRLLVNGIYTATAYGYPLQVGSGIIWDYFGEIWELDPSDNLPFTSADLASAELELWDANTLWDTYAVDFKVIKVSLTYYYDEAPVATVTGPAEASSVTTTTRPVVTWTYTDPESDAQERYRVKIFTTAQYSIGGFDPETSPNTWDSGEVTSAATSVTCGVDLTNTVTYRAYVKVADVSSNGRYGVWDNNTFTINVTPPPVPTLTVTAQVANATGPRTKLDIVRVAGPPATTFLVIEYLDAGQTVWQPVRGASRISNVPDGTTFTIYDYEGTPDVQRSYRAKAILAAPSDIASAYTATQNVTLSFPDWWIKDVVGVDTSNYKPEFSGPVFTRSENEEQAKFLPLGRKNAVILRGVIRGEELVLPFVCTTLAQWQAFQTVRALQRPILLQRGYTSEQWYVSLGPTREITEAGYDPNYKQFSITATVVDKP